MRHDVALDVVWVAKEHVADSAEETIRDGRLNLVEHLANMALQVKDSALDFAASGALERVRGRRSERPKTKMTLRLLVLCPI